MTATSRELYVLYGQVQYGVQQALRWRLDSEYGAVGCTDDMMKSSAAVINAYAHLNGGLEDLLVVAAKAIDPADFGKDLGMVALAAGGPAAWFELGVAVAAISLKVPRVHLTAGHPRGNTHSRFTIFADDIATDILFPHPQESSMAVPPVPRRADKVVDSRTGLVLAFAGIELITRLRDIAADCSTRAEEDLKVEQVGPNYTGRVLNSARHATDAMCLIMVVDKLDPNATYELTLDDLRNLGLYRPPYS